MLKLLIIEDHIEMVKAIQTQMEKLNWRFDKNNTYCFASPADVPSQATLSSLSSVDPSNERVILSTQRDRDTVFESVQDFLCVCDDHGDRAVVMIDVLLNSQNISAPSFLRYKADNEYSCELYAELMRLKNGKLYNGKLYNGRSLQNFDVLIYSRSDASIGVVETALQAIYNEQDENYDRPYFPRECAKYENISWCKNNCDETDENLNVIVSDTPRADPLALPESYQEYFKNLS